MWQELTSANVQSTKIDFSFIKKESLSGDKNKVYNSKRKEAIEEDFMFMIK